MSQEKHNSRLEVRRATVFALLQVSVQILRRKTSGIYLIGVSVYLFISTHLNVCVCVDSQMLMCPFLEV